MKIDGRGVIPLDTKRLQADKKTKLADAAPKAADAAQSEKARPRNEEEIAKALESTVEDIGKSGVSAGDVHSKADEARITGFLKSIDVQGKQPRLSDGDVLKLADKVASSTQADPQQASAAFNTPDATRVAELV